MKSEQRKNVANSFSFCRSSSQTNDEFEPFLKNVELTLDKIHEENPFMISVLGGFKVKSNTWCIDAVTSNYGLHQQSKNRNMYLTHAPLVLT